VVEITAVSTPEAGRETWDSVNCRLCGANDLGLVVDLGVQPLANSYVPPVRRLQMEPHYPLVVLRCPHCHLVQVPEIVSASEIFSDYQYFSSYATSWVDHARAYVERMAERFALTPRSRMIEVASNDGYLLQFARAKQIQVLGVEPAANVARVAEQRGIPTYVGFFGRETAARLRADGWSCDLMTANNVLAHVPDINDFAAGFALLLKPDGVATFEFPHLLNLIRENQFDTIYHEHFSYISLMTAQSLFSRHGLRVFDVEKLPTHGGSLRLFVCHENAPHADSAAIADLLKEERQFGLDRAECYAEFSTACVKVKNELLKFLIACAERGETVCGYGAAAKGNTLLNFCGVRPDNIRFVADRSPHKQGHLLPGTRIPVRAPDELFRQRPDFLLILPWNLKDEIAQSMNDLRAQGCRFVTAIPSLNVF
jgi:2-polyprenyl-3-methyl-5-hydroxy-6-metoxy-1,4-benzoquinol methylase